MNEIKCVMTGERRNREKTREKNRAIISAACTHERLGSWVLGNQEELEHKHCSGSGAQIFFCLILVAVLFCQDQEEQTPSAPIGGFQPGKIRDVTATHPWDRSHSAGSAGVEGFCPVSWTRILICSQ